MQNLLAITAMGEHRPGLLEPVIKIIHDCGGSIVDSRMSVLGDRFSLMMMLSGTWDVIAKIENAVPRIENELGITVISQRAAPREKADDLMPYAIEVIAVDRNGLVHQIVQFFVAREINIEDIYSGNYTASRTGTQMFSLHMTISVPTDISIAAMRNEFMDFCDQLNLDAIMEPVK